MSAMRLTYRCSGHAGRAEVVNKIGFHKNRFGLQATDRRPCLRQWKKRPLSQLVAGTAALRSTNRPSIQEIRSITRIDDGFASPLMVRAEGAKLWSAPRLNQLAFDFAAPQ